MKHVDDSPADALADRLQSRRALFPAERLCKGAADAGLGAVVAVSRENFTYGGGTFLEIPIHLTFAVTSADGRQALIVNQADEPYVRATSWITDVRAFPFGSRSVREDNGEAVRLLAEAVTDLGLSQASVGIETSVLPAAYQAQLGSLLPGVKWEPCEAVFEQARLIKTPAEVEVLRVAAALADGAAYEAVREVDAGDSERRLARLMQVNALSAGAHAFTHVHAQTGIRSTVTHSTPSGSAMRSGEVLHIDFGAQVLSYCSDVSRNAIVGTPTPRQADIYARLVETHATILELIRPGVAAGEVWAGATEAFGRVGLRHPWTSFGHSLGLNVHEGLEMSEGSAALLQPGMVVAIEPSHIEPGDARYHLEDMLFIAESGAELLTDVWPTTELLRIG